MTLNTVNVDGLSFKRDCEALVANNKISDDALKIYIKSVKSKLETCGNDLPGDDIVSKQNYKVYRLKNVEFLYSQTGFEIKLYHLMIIESS